MDFMNGGLVRLILIASFGYWGYQHFVVDRQQARTVAAAKAQSMQNKGQPNDVVMYSLTN